MKRIENTLLLPFNRESMNKRFSHRSPDGNPSGDGYWFAFSKELLHHLKGFVGVVIGFVVQPIAGGFKRR